MARMIPPQPPEGSENELLIYELLKDCPDTDDWTVIHQLDFSKHVSQSTGEADAIVLIPNHGALFLEIKGFVEFENGQWFVGGSREPKRSPFRQAKGAMFSIVEWLQAEHPTIRTMPMYWGAIFTKTRWTLPIPDATHEQLIDSSRIDLSDPGLLRDAIREMMSFGRQELTKQPIGFYFGANDPSLSQIAEFVSALRPTVHPPQDLVATIWARVMRFTTEQLGALDECETEQQITFKGLAGTGKTVLAMEFAARESSRGKRVLFVCYTKLARERLSSSSGSSKNLVVKGAIELAIDLVAKTAGTTRANELARSLVDGPHAFEALVQQANEHSHLLENRAKFDTLIVDEAQDLMAEDLLAVLGTWVRGGLSDGKWVFFLDPNQWIFGGRGIGLEEFVAKHPKSRVRSLLANCRNTENIALFANKHGLLKEPDWYDKLLVKHRSDPSHPKPSVTYYDDSDHECRLLLAHLMKLLDDGIPPGEIVVLSASRGNSAAARLQAQGFGKLLVQYDLKATDRIRFDTVHHFKGLEAFCVVVTDIEQMPDQSSYLPIRELLYTAITRAVFRLDCFVAASLAPSFQGGT